MHRYLLQCRSRENSLWLGWLESLMIFQAFLPHLISMSWRAGSSAPVMYSAVRTTLCSAMRSRVVLLPSQAEVAASQCSQLYSCRTFSGFEGSWQTFKPPEGKEAMSPSSRLHDYNVVLENLAVHPVQTHNRTPPVRHRVDKRFADVNVVTRWPFCKNSHTT